MSDLSPAPLYHLVYISDQTGSFTTRFETYEELIDAVKRAHQKRGPSEAMTLYAFVGHELPIGSPKQSFQVQTPSGEQQEVDL